MSDAPTTARRRVVVEADGGSRGNPGPAAYGAVVMDAETGDVIAEDARTLGRATNNVAEYSGLIAGLRLVAEVAPDAEVEVRMDSKLVVEQMSGRWKIKHPDMKPLAAEAAALAPAGTTYTWIPRERNAHADRLANEALDGQRDGVTIASGAPAPEISDEDSLIEEIESPAAAALGDEPARAGRGRGWSSEAVETTTLVLVRHGVTAHTTEKRFSGGLGSANPGLSEEGREQIRTTGRWLSEIADRVDVVVASPVRRTRESAEILADMLDCRLDEEPAVAEMEFGDWDGLTFADVLEKDRSGLERWLGSVDVAPPGGESFSAVQERVLEGLDRLLAAHHGRTVVVVSHVTPIKTLVAHVLGAPLQSLFRMELSPAAVSVLSFYEGMPEQAPQCSMRLFNATPPERDLYPS